MKTNYVKVVAVIDASGSMAMLRSSTIDGFNEFLESQQELDGDADITTVTFQKGLECQYDVLHNGCDIRQANKLTEEDYRPGGLTPLYDALGTYIDQTGKILSDMAEEDRPERVIFVIITDGAENASTQFTGDQIREMITHQQEKYNWKFIFLGANIDSFQAAGDIGIGAAYTANYSHTNIGTQSVYSAIDSVVSTSRGYYGPRGDRGPQGAVGDIGEDWKKDIV